MHFHRTHVYTTELWTSENAASSNFAFALASFVMIIYTVRIEDAKGLMIKDLHFTMVFLHTCACFVYNGFSASVYYLLFVGFVGGIVVVVGLFVSTFVEQRRLHTEIMQI